MNSAPSRTEPAQLSRLLVIDSVPGGGLALEIRFPAGFPGGFAPARLFRHPRYDGNGLAWSAAANTGFLYVEMHLRLSPGFSLNGNVVKKLLYANSNVPDNAALTSHPPRSTSAQPAAERANNVNDGRWHLLEMVQEPNRPGVKNGRIQIFIDGRLAGNWQKALLFEKGQTPSLNSLSINTVFGGGSNPVTADQQLLVGPLRVMGH